MTIKHHDLANVDLNLLVALDALLTERSVTRAASQIGIGQSAMSSSLARLRRLLGTNYSFARQRACTRCLAPFGTVATEDRNGAA